MQNPQLPLDISNSQGDQKTARYIESLRYRVVVCLSCLPRGEDICSRYQKVRDTEYSRYRKSTVLSFEEQKTSHTKRLDFLP